MANSDFIVLELSPPSCTVYKNSINENDIQRLNIHELSYNDFYWKYMERNFPVILMEVSTQWECRRNWIMPATECLEEKEIKGNEIVSPVSSASSINYDYLRRKIGNCLVPVANCNKEYYNSHSKSEMPFFDFLIYWEKRRADSAAANVFSPELSNINNKTTTTEDLFYLKDWHLKAQNANYDFYKVPKYFASDWLNEHLVETRNDDYRFVYMGPRKTWTPFHSDVFGSFSWSTNIMGVKKWLILPPGEEIKLADPLGNLPFDIDEKILEYKNVKYFTIMQYENESLFVPSGWYHQVWNISDTISINHNWFNACNLQRIWCNLNNQLEKVIREIYDCRKMDNFMEHCQTMLRASFGLNYFDFLELLECITKRRLGKFNNNTASEMSSTSQASLPSYESMSSTLIFFDQFIPNDYHVHHDVERILQVIELMLQNTTICDDRTVLYRKCIQLKELITSAIS